MDIIWKNIDSFPGYEVSNDGQIRSDRGLMTLTTTEKGYITTRMSHFGSQRKVRVHRIVYEAFAGPIPEGMQIDHIDGIRDNNVPENLRVVTSYQNHCNRMDNQEVQSGHRYVIWDSRTRRWIMAIWHDRTGSSKSFYALEDAVLARDERLRELGSD